MSKYLKLTGVSFACVLITSWTVLADGFRNPPEGAKALGKAGVATVNVKDSTAISHNPAAMSGLERRQAIISLTPAWNDQDYDSPAGSASTTEELKLLPNLYYAQPVGDDGFVLGVGVTTPFGQSTVWEEDSVFRYTSPYFGEMKLINVNPTLSKKLNDKFSIGVGVDIYWSELTLKQFLPWSAATGNPAAPDGKIVLEGDGTTVGGNAGLVYHINDKHTVGLSYRSGFDIEYEGDASIGNFPAGFPAGQPRSDFSTEIEFPTIIALGYGVDVNDKLSVEAQVEWLEHSTYESLDIDVEENNTLLAPTSIPQDWEDTWTFGIGADYKCAEHCTVRAGYAFIESPIPDETFSPSIPDSDRHVFAIGAGYAKDDNFLDLAYAYSLLEDRDIDNNQNPAYNGKYEFNPHLVAITYGHNF